MNDRTERDLINVGVSLYRGGKLEEEGTGANVLDGPVSAIRYLHSGLSKIKNQDFLSAGDIITTGTPPGVGMGMKPQQFLKAGDTLRLSIESLGEQNSKVVSL